MCCMFVEVVNQGSISKHNPFEMNFKDEAIKIMFVAILLVQQVIKCIDYIKYGRSLCDVTRRFLKSHCEAQWVA